MCGFSIIEDVLHAIEELKHVMSVQNKRGNPIILHPWTT